MMGLCEQSTQRRTARDHERVKIVIEKESDPEQHKRKMLRYISLVQRQAAMETDVKLRCTQKANHNHPCRREKRLAETGLQRDVDTRAQSSADPMPSSGMDMNGSVTDEQCE